MKKIFLSIGVVCSAIAFSQNVDLQRVRNTLSVYNGEINAGTARSLGMSNAMGALGGDLSAINSNPAASAVFRTSNIGFTLGFESDMTESTFSNTLKDENTEFGFKNVGGVLVFDVDNGNSQLKSISLAISAVNENVNQYTKVGRNNNIQFDALDTSGNVVDTYTFESYRDLREATKSQIAFNIGANIDHKFYLGTNLNFHSADVSHSLRYAETNLANETFYYDSENTPYRENADGFSFGIGAIAKINQNVRLGASYTSPVWWNYVATDYQFHDLDNSEIGWYFFDQDKVKGSGKIAVSGAVVFENFAFNIDYIKHFNKNSMLKDVEYYQPENTFFDNAVTNSNEIRLGAEYRIKKLKLRAGIASLQSPMENVNFTSGLTNGQNLPTDSTVSDLFIGDRHSYSFGLGYNFGDFYIDAAYQNVLQEYNYVLGGKFIDSDLFEVDLDNYLIQSRNVSDNFVLTLGWNF